LPMQHQRIEFGDIGRDEVRRCSAEHALRMLGALA
jgi:hypothetical protein